MNGRDVVLVLVSGEFCANAAAASSDKPRAKSNNTNLFIIRVPLTARIFGLDAHTNAVRAADSGRHREALAVR